MEVTCRKCGAKLNVPDNKLPKGRVFAIPCPRCKEKIPIDTRNVNDRPKSLIDEVSSSSYDAGEKPFDFLEEGAITALICENDPKILKDIKSAVTSLGYRITVSSNSKEALKLMRFHIFDLVVINESFDSPGRNYVLEYLQNMPMGTRRNIFCALITDQHRTMDNMAAFNKSVNMVINTANIDQFEKILKKGIADYQLFYKLFKESMAKVGLL